MNKTRIWSGFSLVEMMLLLVITSLMLASGVTVISKKHVKVPKIAMHGAYMCYYKDGKLHQEQYVGSTLTKKIMDEDAGTECRFKPPARASYLYIQATAGGGGGGDAGYHGGNLQVFESATEVMSPFGITQGILDLKGINSGELSSLGGKLYAYANATGDGGGKQLTKPGGDAGDGGDLYYIKQDTTPICLKYREWEYKGNEEIGYSCTKCKSKSYTRYNYRYSAYDDCCQGGYYWTTCSDSYYTGYYGTCKSGYYKSGSYCYRDYSCQKWDSCKSTYTCNQTSGSCYTESKPTSSHSPKYKTMKVSAVDTYTFDYQNKEPNPPKRVYEVNAANGDSTKEKERQVLRDQNDTYSICNYGNPSKFSGVSDGIFGSFFQGFDPVSVSCDTGGIREAFGDDIIPMGGGSAAIAKIVTKMSSEVYSQKILYDGSETNNSAYGTRCFSDAQPGKQPSTNMPTTISDCGKNTQTTIAQGANDPNSYFNDPPQKSLVYDYSVSQSSSYTDTCPTNYDHISKSLTSSPTYSEPVYDRSCCTTWKEHSSGTECLRTYSPSSKYASYYPEKVDGGKGGKGVQCRTNDIGAGLGIKYIGNSDVVPGIRGSDKNCTGAGYKAMYTEAEWKSQPSCYAQNGTDSQGSARVELGGDSCEVNVLPPTKGQGARKKTTGGTIPEAGKSAPVDGVGRAKGTQTGNTKTGTCGDNHVGYCLTRKNGGTEENGKYTYKYTWNTNYLQYGEGGKAGGYNVKLIRSVKDGEYIIIPGKGGAGGAEGTGNAGEDGGDTTIQFAPEDGEAAEAVLTVLGGAGGPGGLVTPTEQLPTWYQNGDFIKGQNGTPGEEASMSNIKSNIMNLVLPTGDDNILNQWLLASGAGGDGGGSRNYCWASEWQRWFEGERVKGSIGLYLDATDMETHACRKGTYWSSTPVAQNGISGVVVIRW